MSSLPPLPHESEPIINLGSRRKSFRDDILYGTCNRTWRIFFRELHKRFAPFGTDPNQLVITNWENEITSFANTLVCSSDYTLETAVSDAGSSDYTIIVNDTQTLTANLTIPANVTLKVTQSGLISGAFTLTINGNLEAGLYQVFGSDITVTFGENSVYESYPQWWGAVAGTAEDQDGDDQGPMFQKCFDSGAQRIFVPSGYYMVEASTTYSGKTSAGLDIASNTELIFERGAVLVAFDTSASVYAILKIYDRENIYIRGGRLHGDIELDDRGLHSTVGQGHGMRVHGCINVVIENMECENCVGDGFYIGYSFHSGSDLKESVNVRLLNCIAHDNYRNGISTTGCEGGGVFGGDIYSNGGDDGVVAGEPKSGMDIEPNPDGDPTAWRVQDYVVSGVTFRDNSKYGLFVALVEGSPDAITESIEIIGCNFRNNDNTGLIVSKSHHIVVSSNSFSGSSQNQGIQVDRGQWVTIADNRINDMSSHGIIIRNEYSGTMTDVSVIGNVIQNCDTGISVSGQVDQLIDGFIFANNIIASCRRGYVMTRTYRAQVHGNVVHDITGNDALQINNSYDLIISENNIITCTQNGIDLDTCDNIVIKGNRVQLSDNHGIYATDVNQCMISGNIISENSQSQHKLSNNITLAGTSTYNTITNNIIKRGTGAIQPAWGISISVATVENTVITDNENSVGGATGNVNDSGTNTHISRPSNNDYEVLRSGGSVNSVISTWSATDAHHSVLSLNKYPSDTIDAKSPTAAGESLGAVEAKGVNYSNAEATAVQFLFEGDERPNDDYVPGKITIKTSSTTGLQNVLMIDDDQLTTFYENILIGDTKNIYFSNSGGGDHAKILFTEGDPDTWDLAYHQNTAEKARIRFTSTSEAADDGFISFWTGEPCVERMNINDTNITVYTDGLVSGTKKWQFGDAGTYLNQSADGILQIASDNEVELNATLFDINANVDISGTLGVGGLLTVSSGITGYVDNNTDNYVLTSTGGNTINGEANFTFDGSLNCDAAAIFNESGADVDFRVESSAGTHSLFIQGSDGFVGINQSNPVYQFMISNSAATQFAIHRDSNTIGHSSKFILALDDSAGNVTEYGALVAQIIDNTNGSEDARMVIQCMDNGTRSNRFTVENDGEIILYGYTAGSIPYIGSSTEIAESSDLFWDSAQGFMGIGTNSPQYTLQVTNSAATQFTIHRDAGVIGNSAKFILALNDSGGNLTEYGAVVAQIVDNTNGSEDGRVVVQCMSGGTRTNRLSIEPDGSVKMVTNSVNFTQGASDDVGMQFNATDWVFDYDLLNSGTTDFRIQENGTDKFVITTGGAIDIASTLTVGDILDASAAGLKTIQSVANFSDPPTDAELDAAFGTPATLGRGFVATIDDNSDETDFWLVATSDNKWWYVQMTAAT